MSHDGAISNEPPEFPAGAYVPPESVDAALVEKLVAEIATFPERIRAAVEGLSDEQLDTKYRNWSIRQIVHHLADSHMNCYIRFKWALTETSPLIKSYDEGRWSEVVDATSSPIDSSLVILEGLHARWASLLSQLLSEQMESTFFHPEQMKIVSLNDALPSYVWHGDHHMAQILWVRQQQGW